MTENHLNAYADDYYYDFPYVVRERKDLFCQMADETLTKC